jgi:hypothetical protein
MPQFVDVSAFYDFFFCGNGFTSAGWEQAEIRTVTSVVQRECNLEVITDTKLHHLNKFKCSKLGAEHATVNYL